MKTSFSSLYSLRSLSTPLWLSCALLSFLAGCEARPPEPESRKSQPVEPAPPAAPEKLPQVEPWTGDFTLEHATQGLPGEGPLSATIETNLGALKCELFEDKAPLTVANFVGLARGLRPFQDASKRWVKRPGYDGTKFHRIIRGFMIQGGDPAGTGRGEPGYTIADEIWEGAKHDQRGLLCMANRGPNTNGMQFFILDGPAPHLDGGYTIFGHCSPDSVIEQISSVKTRGDRPENPPIIQRVTIERGS